MYLVLNPDCAIGIYYGIENAAATLVSRFCSFNVFMNTPRSQNRSNFASRKRFLRLVTIPTAQSGFNPDCAIGFHHFSIENTPQTCRGDLPAFSVLI